MNLKRTIWIAAAVAVLGVPFGTAFAENAEPAGSDTCSACHSAQTASFNSSMHAKKLPLVRKLGADKTCEACHGAGSLHAAAGGDRANPGFATIKNPAKMDPKETAKMCFSCHKQKEVMLWSTSSHAEGGVSCNKCHSVHAGKGQSQLKKGADETCYQCHAKQKAEGKLASHHPVAEGKMQCVSCHNPHGGPLGNMKAESVEEVCFKCHAEKAGPYVHEHPPVAEGCDVCHKQHGSINESMLKQSQPYLCMRCHKWPHTERNLTGGRNEFKVAKIPERQRCTDCHREIHGSDRHAAFKN